VLAYVRKRRIKFVVFIPGCELKFRTLLTIGNTILLIVYSSLLCWTKRNCRIANRQQRTPPSRLVQHLWPHPELLLLRELIPRRQIQLHIPLPQCRNLLQHHLTVQTRVRPLFCKEQEQRSLLHPPFLLGAHRTLSATIALVLATSS
jgi:hypothetical protein